MAAKKTVEEKVIDTVRESPKPPETGQVLQKLGDNSSVGQAIISLIGQGKLQVTLDRKLKAME